MLSEQVTLGEARDWLRKRVEEGENCPCCTQFAKIYKRQITSTSARALISLYRSCRMNFGHLPTVLGRKQADETKMVFWGLIEEEKTLRPDGGRAGYWRVTDKGRRFLLGEISVPKYARVYNGRCLNLLGKDVTVVDCLGKKFNYAELMAA